MKFKISKNIHTAYDVYYLDNGKKRHYKKIDFKSYKYSEKLKIGLYTFENQDKTIIYIIDENIITKIVEYKNNLVYDEFEKVAVYQ